MQRPPRGAREGVRQDVQSQKDSRGAGFSAGKGTTAWTHNFLNQKPWHPLNWRNQTRQYEAEQEYEQRRKQEEAAKAEFEAEQQYLETLGHLPTKEAEKYRQMQGVSWMYVKPPGLSAQRKRDEAGPSSPQHAEPSKPRIEHQHQPPSAQEHSTRSGRERGAGTAGGGTIKFKRRAQSPPIGGSWQDTNQQFVIDDTSAALQLEALEAEVRGSQSKSKQRRERETRHKRKHKHKHKRSRSRRRSSSPESASGCALDGSGQDQGKARHADHGSARERTPEIRDRQSRSRSAKSDHKSKRRRHEQSFERASADTRHQASTAGDRRLKSALQLLMDEGIDIGGVLKQRDPN